MNKIINKGGDRLRKFERKKWLTEIMDEVGIDLTKDNLLIAPIGSGKTLIYSIETRPQIIKITS